MAKIVRKYTNPRQVIRIRKKRRIRKKVRLHMGAIPRLVITRSNCFLYAQLIDDLKGHTLAHASTREKQFESLASKKNLEAAKALGKVIGRTALGLTKFDKVLFDRNGYDYHGRVKAFADAAREAGLKF